MDFFGAASILEHKLWATVFQPALHIALILVLAWIVLKLAKKAIKLLQKNMLKRTSDSEGMKRVGTLGNVFRYIVSVVIAVIAIMLVLDQIGISIAPILAAAGVVGLAVGFGAQTLVKDFFTGFFLLLENQVRQGDVIEAGGKSGLVEEITLRYIKMRDYDGDVHFVPNSTITAVTNKSRGFAYAVIDVRVGYREKIDEVFELIRKVASEMRKDLGNKILEDAEIAGVENLTDTAVIVKARVKVAPLEQWNVRREFLRRVKTTFDEHGIEIPYPYVTPDTAPVVSSNPTQLPYKYARRDNPAKE